MLKREIQVREREIEEKMAQSEDDYSESTYDWETDSINVAISNELDTLLAEVEAGKNLKPNIAKLDSLWEESNANRNSDYAYFTPEIGYILACAYKQDNDIKKAKTTARMAAFNPEQSPPLVKIPILFISFPFFRMRSL